MPSAVLLEQETINHELAAIVDASLQDLQNYQFEDDPVAALHPGEEIYGRSLSTIHRLGTLMLTNSGIEAIESPEAQQAKVEFFTSVEEGFGTDMELGGGLEVRDFDERPVIDGKVMAKDLKTPISDMTEAGLECARQTLKKDSRFRPQLVRSEWDHANALTVDAMARGETAYNTRIIVSPFPEEAAAKSGDDYWRGIGYVPHLKRGFVQLYHLNKDGVLVSGSLSFDRSIKARIIGALAKYGVKIPADEVTDNILNYAVTDTLTEAEAKLLATDIADMAAGPRPEKTTNTVDVTHKYKSLMERVFNESYMHVCESNARGRQTPGLQKLIQQLSRNSKAFNDGYKRALQAMHYGSKKFTNQDSIILHELLVYSTIEMMRSLHLGNTSKIFQGTDMTAFTAFQIENIDSDTFQNMLGGFGAEGAKNKRTYSACGLSINLGEQAENPQAAFGGADNEKSEKRWMNCPHCKARVFGDPCAKVIACNDCRAFVVNGVTWSKGNGGERKKEQQRQKKLEKRREKEAARAKKVEQAAVPIAGLAMMNADV